MKGKDVLRPCEPNDFEDIYTIINDGAQAYKGVIPADRWHDPYMSRPDLEGEIQDNVLFWGIEQRGRLTAVMGIQDKGEVNLIRHAYVRTQCHRQGLGSRLLTCLAGMTAKPILIGTWADARWAVSFYQKHGYVLLEEEEKERVLKKYWRIPPRQVETSVVLADPRWFQSAWRPLKDRVDARSGCPLTDATAAG
ncbi:MAG: N-acetyltransferase [Desulfobacteraceae bacterium]|nr:MAG: N-acetyltransferase [Desulfobacteraceae bacterium]